MNGHQDVTMDPTPSASTSTSTSENPKTSDDRFPRLRFALRSISLPAEELLSSEQAATAIEAALAASENASLQADQANEELHRQIHSLTAESNSLRDRYHALIGDQQPKSARPRPIIPDPPPFKGEETDKTKLQTEYRNFQTQVRSKMQADAATFESEYQKIVYVSSRIQGKASSHISSYMRNTDFFHTQAADPGGPFFKSWDEIFDHVLDRIYGIANRRIHAEAAMATLKQANKPFNVFFSEFSNFLADLDWNDSAKVAALRTRISFEMKDKLIAMNLPADNDFPGWCNMLADLAQRLESFAADEKRRPAQFIHQSSAAPQPRQTQQAQVNTTSDGEPMQLDATRLTVEQRRYRIQNNLCLYCGKPGHIKATCVEAHAKRQNQQWPRSGWIQQPQPQPQRPQQNQQPCYRQTPYPYRPQPLPGRSPNVRVIEWAQQQETDDASTVETVLTTPSGTPAPTTSNKDQENARSPA
jgi:hypothetical protein